MNQRDGSSPEPRKSTSAPPPASRGLGPASRAPRRPPGVPFIGTLPPDDAVRVLDVIGVSKRFGEKVVLDDVTFHVPIGEFLCLCGPNGAGKSTLLRVLLGLRQPQGGSVTVGGVELGTLDLQKLRRSIAYLPQRPYLGEHYATIRSALRGLDEDASDGAMRAAIDRVGLGNAARSGDVLDVEIGELSAGQRQRLALARVLLHDAAIYLLDEPDANLDRAGIALVAELVRDLAARGRMVAIAAHTGELAAIPGVRLRLP